VEGIAGPQEIYGCGLTALLLPDFSALAGAAQKERRELVYRPRPPPPTQSSYAEEPVAIEQISKAKAPNLKKTRA
jgi:hypothetical protein